MRADHLRQLEGLADRIIRLREERDEMARQLALLTSDKVSLTLDEAKTILSDPVWQGSLLWAACNSIVSLHQAVSSLEQETDGAIVLCGWTCACGTWNGDEKERRLDCRHCNRKRP